MTEKDKAALNSDMLALERIASDAKRLKGFSNGARHKQADLNRLVKIIEKFHTLAPAVVGPVASGKTANTERKNASDYWARHNAPEPEKAQGDDPVGYIDANQLERWRVLRGTEYETAERCYMPWSKEPLKTDISDCCVPVYLKPLTERREPPADLSAIKRECVEKCGLENNHDKAVAFEVIDFLSGRISGVSKEQTEGDK